MSISKHLKRPKQTRNQFITKLGHALLVVVIDHVGPKLIQTLPREGVTHHVYLISSGLVDIFCFPSLSLSLFLSLSLSIYLSLSLSLCHSLSARALCRVINKFVAPVSCPHEMPSTVLIDELRVCPFVEEIHKE